MATITKSPEAPAGVVHFNFAAGSFALSDKDKTYKTDARELIADAKTHPWLAVTEKKSKPKAATAPAEPKGAPAPAEPKDAQASEGAKDDSGDEG